MTEGMCGCGDAATHDGDVPVCCWCWVVEHARPPHEGHGLCMVAAKRIEKIQARFRTAVLSERECCARIVEEAKPAKGIMPFELVRALRKTPEHAIAVIVSTLAENLAGVIRSRIDPVPSAKAPR